MFSDKSKNGGKDGKEVPISEPMKESGSKPATGGGNGKDGTGKENEDLSKFVESLKSGKTVDESMKGVGKVKGDSAAKSTKITRSPEEEAMIQEKLAKGEKNRLGDFGWKKNERGPVSWTIFAATLLAGFGVVAYFQVEMERKKEDAIAKKSQKSYGKAKLGGPYSLVDSNGMPVTDKTFAGQYILLYFGFTYCPDICPHELVKLGRVIDRLDAMGLDHKVQPVFVSVDPKRDSVAQLREYAKDFHPRLISLTGTPGQVEAACRAYRVFYQNTNETKEDEEDYLVDHSIISYLIGPSGEFIDFFTQQREIEEIVDTIAERIEDEVGLVSDEDDL